jgi:hypothetical protein
MENRVERKRPRLTLNPLDAEEKDQKAMSITAGQLQHRSSLARSVRPPFWRWWFLAAMTGLPVRKPPHLPLLHFA